MQTNQGSKTQSVVASARVSFERGGVSPRWTALAILALAVGCGFARAQTHSIDWHSIDTGGGLADGGVFSLDGTFGQPDAGAMNGGIYSLVGGFWGTDGSGQTPLILLTQPADATNAVFSTVNFTARAQGGGPLRYQWRLDGAPLADDGFVSGSGEARLSIKCLLQSHAGGYDVVIHESASPQNSITSRVATLTIEGGSQWVLRATNGPPPRFLHAMVYDSARRVTVMFGGQTNWNAIRSLGDLWEWDGARWTERMPDSETNGWAFANFAWRVAHAERPVQRSRHAMAYDSRRGRVVLFGGQSFGPGSATANLRDLWEWDGARWHFRGTNGPVARIHSSMAYDERRGRTVLFGGQPIPGLGEIGDAELVWEWDGDRWHTNLPPRNPSGSNYRAQSRMAYDSFRGVIVFGPTTESHSHWAFWDWDGVNWTIFPVLHYIDPIVTAFHGTSLGGFSFDAHRRRAAWFGGLQIGVHNKTGFFDGKAWTLLANGAAAPPSRVFPAMAYDSDRRAHVLFGGAPQYGAGGGASDTWELIAEDLPVIDEQPASQIRLAGETASFKVRAVGHGALEYQWYFGNKPVAGGTGDSLMIPAVGASDAGEYWVAVSNQCGSTASRPAALTLNPNLQILTIGGELELVWSDPDALLEETDGLGNPWMIVPGATAPFRFVARGQARFFRLRRGP